MTSPPLQPGGRPPLQSDDLFGSFPIRFGKVIAGKYRVGRVLGRGGSSVVLEATHVQLGQRVALKLLRGSSPNGFKRLLREAQDAAKLTGEHTARVYDVGVEEGEPYIVMEYLPGEDLGRYLAGRGTLPWQEAVPLLLQACEGVAEAHAAGIVHRDIKPSNLFVLKRADGSLLIKVFDFGIAARCAPGRGPPRAAGSPGYMPPEQLAGDDVDVRADVWALGAVLYRLLTGRVPFAVRPMREMLVALVNERPEPIGIPDLPAELAAIMLRCLEADRTKRPACVAELIEALTPFDPMRAMRMTPVPVSTPKGALADAIAKRADADAITQGAPAAEVDIGAPDTEERPGAWTLPQIAAAGGRVVPLSLAVVLVAAGFASSILLPRATSRVSAAAEAVEVQPPPTQRTEVSALPPAVATSYEADEPAPTPAPASLPASRRARSPRPRSAPVAAAAPAPARRPPTAVAASRPAAPSPPPSDPFDHR